MDIRHVVKNITYQYFHVSEHDKNVRILKNHHKNIWKIYRHNIHMLIGVTLFQVNSTH